MPKGSQCSMPLVRWLRSAPLVVAVVACDDSVYVKQLGATAPRLSAVAMPLGVGSKLYATRLLVAADPVDTEPEWLAVVASGGPEVSMEGERFATALCARAAPESTLIVRSALGTAALTVTLGRWALTAGDAGPELGPSSRCGASRHFRTMESLSIGIPSATDGPLDAGETLQDSATTAGGMP